MFTVDERFATEMEMTKEEVTFAIQRLQEVNPMLGLRGCRLGIVIPELVEMQARAMIEAAINNQRKGLNPKVEIMIPLICSATEFTHQSSLIRQTAEQVFHENHTRIDYKIGTMIEVPRAALTSNEIVSAGAQFFSYGTNDLTQMTYGFSRDDIGAFLPTYLKSNILDKDPFETIDEIGVGSLIKQSVAVGRSSAIEVGLRDFKVGVCGKSNNFIITIID